MSESKELAVEFAIEYIKSWNSAANTRPINTEQALDILTAAYKTISRFDKAENQQED